MRLEGATVSGDIFCHAWLVSTYNGWFTDAVFTVHDYNILPSVWPKPIYQLQSCTPVWQARAWRQLLPSPSLFNIMPGSNMFPFLICDNRWLYVGFSWLPLVFLALLEYVLQTSWCCCCRDWCLPEHTVLVYPTLASQFCFRPSALCCGKNWIRHSMLLVGRSAW